MKVKANIGNFYYFYFGAIYAIEKYQKLEITQIGGFNNLDKQKINIYR